VSCDIQSIYCFCNNLYGNIALMDIIWLGQASFKIKGKTATVVTDPYDPSIGLKLPKNLDAQVVLISHNHRDHNNSGAILGEPLVISGPGEYEKLGVTVLGIPTFHDNTSGSERGPNTIYYFQIDGINFVHLGDLGHVLTEEQLEFIDDVDILMVPVGSVYTIDGKRAAQVVSQLEPKVVIPMHYKIPELSINLEGPESFLKEMGAENATPQPKLSITKDKLPEETTVVLLDKS